MNIENRFTASLHTHVKSLFDAQIGANELCERIKELGGKGCAITDHGVVSSIEDYKEVFKKHGLKLIPGVEMYVDGGILGRTHLILLAKNDNGWRGISRIVTKAGETMQGDFPVISKEALFELVSEFKGDIIATSACMYGVINAIYLSNSAVQKAIDKLRTRQEKYISPSSKELLSAKEEVLVFEKELEKSITDRDECKRVAEQKFVQREKSVAKLEKAGDESAKRARTELEKDKSDAEKAKTALPGCKEAAEKAKKALSEAQKSYKKLSESVDKYMELEGEIEKLSKDMQSEEKLDKRAEEVAREYLNAFGSDFYIELQYHGIEEEAYVFLRISALAKKLMIPVVATNDVHILTGSEDERLKRQILRSLRFDNPSNAKFEEEGEGDKELYLKDNYELSEMMLKILDESVVEEAIANIDKIFDECNVEFTITKHYPKYSQTENADEVLDKEILKGIAWRFPEGMPEGYDKRLEYEKSIIKSMGYSDYHLVVKDFLEYGRLLGYVPKERLQEAPLTKEELREFIDVNGFRNQGYRIGTGRGSAVGSLVCYLLGITNLDPIKYNLLFERFLNPERVSMPDIDSDLSNESRGKVIEYVQKKYGEDAVCGIMTTNAIAPKGAIRTASKFYGLKTYGESLFNQYGSPLCKMVPSEVGTSFASIVDMNGKISDEGETLYDYLCSKYKGNKDALEILRWSKIIEGSFTAYGAHAAGIVISPVRISDYLPLRNNTTLGMFTTQCNMVQVEDNGFLKFDFLGLKTLDIITETIFEVEKNTGLIIDPLKIDLEDKDVYRNIFSAAKTNSVFQFESQGMKAMLRRFKPQTFEDIIILVSMFRPGPLQYLDGVIDVKNGAAEMTFLTPALEPILGKTYGAIVYQEQVMEICQKLAGFTLGHADEVRRFMSKKKADKLAHERDAFVEGCKKNGIAEDVSNKLFDQMMDFASYAFNKSHAAAYAYNAYVTAYLKMHYPSEFFMGALNWAAKDADPLKKINGLIYEASEYGIKVLTPNINTSGADFVTVKGNILFGLSAVAGIKNFAGVIIDERQRGGAFKSLKDFITRCHPSSKVLENLISAGALDDFSDNRSSMKAFASDIKKPLSDREKKLSLIESCEKLLPVIESLKSNEEVIRYQEENGLKAEIKEMTTAEKLEKKIENARKSLSKFDSEINAVKLLNAPENKLERAAFEKDVLGFYVSSHPLDSYPKAQEIGAEVISEVGEGDGAIFGIISNLVIKYRKSDGAPMAFFELEDKSGKISVACFTKAYNSAKDLLKDGVIVKIYGKCDIEYEEIVSEDSVDVTETKKFILQSASLVNPNRGTLIMSVSSYAVFHAYEAQDFKKTYEDEGGYKFLLFDEALDEVRTIPYRVSEAVKTLPKVEEVFA